MRSEPDPQPPPENDIGTFMGQENWRQRIRKESARAPKQAEFSVRLAVRALDVTKKPGQVDPFARGAADDLLDQETARTFRAHLVAKTRAPGHHELWPETSQHNIGWLAQDNTAGRPFEDRQTLVAAPPGQGFGWRRLSTVTPPASGHRKEPAAPRARSQSKATSSAVKMIRVAPPSEVPAELQPGPPMQAAPRAGPAARLRRRRRQLRRFLRRQLRRQRTEEAASMVAQASAAPASRPPSAESASQPGPAAGFRRFRKAPIADAWLGPSSDAPKPSLEAHESLEKLSQTAREFLRYGRQSRWERMKEVSNMSKFAHGYTMLWGVNFFAKRGSQQNMQSVLPGS